MAQQPIEMILLRQWASYLDIPLWLMDGAGDLLYYNEPAEEILGLRFDEAGAINAEDLEKMFATTRLDGMPMPNDELPVVRALNTGKPAHGEHRFSALDGIWRHVEVTAFPIDVLGKRHGVVAMFWEHTDP